MKNVISKFLIVFFISFFTSCHFITSFSESDDDGIVLTFDKSKAEVSIGSMEVVNLKASKNQNTTSINWTYDDSIIFAKTDNYSAVITGLKPGTTTLTAQAGSNSVSCLITVSNDSYSVDIINPYVYASTDYVEVKPNETVKVSAALFGGTVSDINGFSWTIDKNSVASLQTEGNYCWITGKNNGIAKVTVKHNTKAAFGYSFLVNCSSDGTSRCYITTTENIITINLSENDTADFGVDLVNPLIADYASGFEYKIVDSLGKEISSRPLVITGSGNCHVSLKAYETGLYYVRCSHPNADYDLDILVRVIAQAETAFIEPSKNIVTVSDLTYEEVSLSLLNYSKDVNPELYTWSFSDDAEEFIEYEIYNGSSNNTGDNIRIKGKKTGSVKITVSYPDVQSRNIIVLVRNVSTEAADATCYITTSQNYISFNPGDDAQQINIMLKNASQDEVNRLKWTITNVAADGSNSKVINWKSGNGNAVSKFASRAVLSDSASAYAVIEPLNIGTAYIDIAHPKALYSTRITVVVRPEKTAEPQKSYLSFTSSSIVSIKNGEQKNLNVSFNGAGKVSDIVWTSDGYVTIAGNGTECVVTSPAAGTGPTRSTVTVTHPNSEYPLRFTVLTYDSLEELNDFDVKSFFSTKTFESLKTNQSTKFYLETFGFKDNPSISWSIIEGASLVTLETENFNKTLIVKTLKVGTVIIKASCEECDDVYFTVKITEEGIIDETKDCYLSTSQNVLYFDDINQSLTFNVDLFNINTYAYDKLEYKLSNYNFEVTTNNNNFTVTSLTDSGTATLTISHPLALNDLVINLRTGNKFEYVNEDTCYISTNEDIFELYPGQEEVSLIASLNHTEMSDSQTISKGFTFECDDETIATISYVNYSNTCYIKPIKNGITKIFVRHPDADFEKEVVVIVNQSPDASTIPYITTEQNVITLIQGNYETVTVSLMNSDSINNSDWIWTSRNPRIMDVIANNGTSALISAVAPGTTEIEVKHKKCLFSLKIIVTVLDSHTITNRPYISTDTNIITIQKGLSTTLTASMIGGNGDSDNNYFRFQASNPSLVLVNSVSGAAYIKGLNTGMSYITIYNSRYTDIYSKTVLVIVEDKQEEGVYIKTSHNILKMKPDDASVTTLSATLVNGESTDGKDFIWWADDYNLIGLTPVAEQCAVIPSGRCGKTYVHVKHAKAAKQVDILVMVSNYDSFAFEKNSANISTDQLYFFPLQVPTIEEDYEVKYSSSNEKVCIIQGSNAVAWVCGINFGNASLTATMVTSDGTVLASTEMLVSVTVPDPMIPTISLGNSIITVEAGTSKTFSAAITGEGLSGSEKFNLKWSVLNKDNGISILDENPDKVAYGSDVYVTFNQGGEYVLLCEHEKSGAMQQIYIIVEEKGEIIINLSTYFETVYKDDGSFTITAELTNATDADYKTISWSALKIGGQNIVAVSKAKGATCTVTPKSVGQTQVIARLPNGKSAMCTVVVKANAEIKFDTGTIHVIPGYTEVVNYTTNPENATINWITQMTTGSSGLTGNITNYFTIEDDTAKKQLRITGKQDYPGGIAGTVTASMVGANSANIPSIKVYVEYKCELNVMDMNGNILTHLPNNNPDTKNVSTFMVSYYPIDLEIDVMKEKDVIACIPYQKGMGHCQDLPEISDPAISIGNVRKEIKVDEKDGIEKVFMTLDVIPHKEADFEITIRASLPQDENLNYTTKKKFYYSAYYDDYDIDVIEMTQSGAFTKFTPDAQGQIDHLDLGDGEEAVFYFKIKNENAIGKIQDLSKDNWEPDTHFKDACYCEESNIYKKTREEKFESLFSKPKENIRSNTTATPTSGMIYFYSDKTNSDAKETVYHLGHAWDYYKDLPEDVRTDESGNDKWKTYKETNNYSNEFISKLVSAEVENWLVTREMVYNNEYYAIPRPNKKTIKPDWEHYNDKDDWWEWCCKHIKRTRGVIKLRYNNNQVYYYRNNGENGHRDISPASTVYEVCTPYVITSQELQNNEVIVRPDGYLSLGYYKGSSFLFFNPYDSDSNGIRMNKLIHPYITPTTYKGTESTDVGKGTLTVYYTLGKTNETKDKPITVNVKKRLCEAYTNEKWEVETVGDKKHWVMKDFVNPGSLPMVATLNISKKSINLKTSEIIQNPESLYIPYSVRPSNQTVTITIPTANGKLTLKNGNASVKEQNGNLIYTISTHDKITDGIGSGELCFYNEGPYTGDVLITSSDTTVNQYVSFEIDKDDFYIARIDKRVVTANNALDAKYSSTDDDSHMLIVGDGETITGEFINQDTYSNTNITNVKYEDFDVFDKNKFRPVSDKDMSGQLQKNLVVQPEVTNQNGKYGFKVIHNKDYGYFSQNNDTVIDEFYSRKFSLSNITINENAVTYETVYKKVQKMNADGDLIMVEEVDNEKTNENRIQAIKKAKLEELNRQKKNYASANAGKAMSSYTWSYYYNKKAVFDSNEKDVDLEGPKPTPRTYETTPIGRFVIETDSGYTQEIFVCVKITEGPCTANTALQQYGYDVPDSYYLSLE